MNPYLMSLVPRLPAASLVIANPPQSPGFGLQSETRTKGRETAAASDASMGGNPVAPLSFRLVKMAVLLIDDPPGVAAPATVSAPPFILIVPPSDLTTPPGPTNNFPP